MEKYLPIIGLTYNGLAAIIVAIVLAALSLISWWIVPIVVLLGCRVRFEQ